MDPQDSENLSAVPPAPDGECPFCRAELAPGATKCAGCGSNVGDIQICTGCREPVRSGAPLCPFCGTRLVHEVEAFSELDDNPWVIHASAFGAFITEQLPTALFYPPILTVSANEIHIRRRHFGGLRTSNQNVQISRVASVRALSGVFWGGLVIETYGGSAEDLAIMGLSKPDAARTTELIERMVRTRLNEPRSR